MFKMFLQLQPAKDITYKYNCWNWLYFLLLWVWLIQCAYSLFCQLYSLDGPYPGFQVVGCRGDAAHPTAAAVWGGTVQSRKETGLHPPPSFLLPSSYLLFIRHCFLKPCIEPSSWFKYFARSWGYNSEQVTHRTSFLKLRDNGEVKQVNQKFQFNRADSLIEK